MWLGDKVKRWQLLKQQYRLHIGIKLSHPQRQACVLPKQLKFVLHLGRANLLEHGSC